MRINLSKLMHIILIAFVIVGVVSISAKADLSDPTLSVYYSFDGEGNTVTDGSANGNNGTVNGSLERADGVYEQALVFDGSTTWIDMNGPEFKNGPVEGFTLAFWVNHSGSGSPQTMIDALTTDHGSGLFHVEIRSGGVRFFHRNETNQTVFNINPGPVLEANTWVHFAGTYDSASGEVKTYLNGEETHSAAGSGTCSANWDVSAGIGHHKNARWFGGLLDEYYLFNRGISADEVMDVMNGALLAVEPEDKLATTWGDIKSQR